MLILYVVAHFHQCFGPLPLYGLPGGPPPFTLRVVGWWMCDTVTGLAHMHHSQSEPLLHRDQKPDNLFVSTGPRRMAILAAQPPGGDTAGAYAAPAAAPAPAPAPSADGATADGSCCWVDVVVKMGDLGLAKWVLEGRSHLSSRAGAGNQATKAPQALLHGNYDAPGDMYAWAKCMCWVIRDALRLPRTETELRTGLVVRLQGL
jgi:serine/threonine protein kinase